jgi:two-component system sensor histidine kinase KdpD
MPDDLPAVRGRQGYIEQVVRHLLASAARFSPAAAAVTLTAKVRGRFVEIRVADHGAPITPEEAATMFDLYARNPRTAADASGANLGLFVARRLVRAMGGEIRALTTRKPAIAFTLPIFPDDE